MKNLYSDDPINAIACLDELKKDSDSFKNSLVTQWDRCVNFANGNQLFNNYGDKNVTADSNGNFNGVQNYNSRQQIYITNEIEPIIRTLASFMTRTKPSITAFTSSDDPEDYSRADLAENLLKAKYDLDEEQKRSREAAYWAMVLGSVFRKDYWDNSSGSNYSTPVYDDLGNVKRDKKTGEVKIQYQKTGMNNVAILTPYSMDFDFSVTDFDEIPWIRENYYADIDWVKESFNRKEPGYFSNNLDSITDGGTGNSNSTGTLSYLENLKYAAPQYGRGSVPGTATANKTVVSEIYIRPTDEWPKGRMIIIAGGKLIYDSPKQVGSPYYMPYEDIVWHPYTMFIYEPWIGRFLGKGIVEQLIPLQMRLNEINGAILENANTLAKVDILAAEGQLRRGIINGKGGNVYTYKPKPGVPPPEKWPGAPLPQQFFQERTTLIDSMVRIAGTNFVMQGQPPTGVSAASAIQQLLDNATSQQSDLMISWEKFHEDGFTKKLRILRNFNKVPDQKVMNYMRQISEDALDMEIKDFTGEDIGDGLTIRIEQGSMIPKNQQLLRDQYTQFAQLGLLGNLAEPGPNGDKLRSELLAKFGEKPLESNTSVEIDKARWENERVKKGMPIVVNEFDNDIIHLSEHIELYQSPKYIERAKPEMKMKLLEHIKTHQAKQQQAQQNAQMQQMQQMKMMGDAQNQYKINEILAGEKAEAQGEAQVEIIKGRNSVMKAEVDGRTKLAEQQLRNKGTVDKEIVQADLAKDFLY